MNESSMATEEMFRVTLNGLTYTFRIVEAIIEGSARLERTSQYNNTAMMGFLSALQDQDQPTKGQVKVEEMLRRGKGLTQFNLMEKDYATFTAAAEEAGLLYAAVCMDKTHKEGERVFTLFCSRDDAFTINNIIELNNLNAVRENDFIQEDVQPEQEAAPEQPEVTGDEPKAEMTDAEKIHQKNQVFIERVTAQEERANRPINPTGPEVTEQKAPSGIASGNSPGKQTQPGPSSRENERPSVRGKIEGYKQEEKAGKEAIREERKKIGQEYVAKMAENMNIER